MRSTENMFKGTVRLLFLWFHELYFVVLAVTSTNLSSVVRQVHSLFQSEFSRERLLGPPLLIYSIFSFT
jgi:hypothetical protein